MKRIELYLFTDIHRPPVKFKGYQFNDEIAIVCINKKWQGIDIKSGIRCTPNLHDTTRTTVINWLSQPDNINFIKVAISKFTDYNHYCNIIERTKNNAEQ